MTTNNSCKDIFAIENIKALIDSIPYAKLIGVGYLPIGDTCIFTLPKNSNNIGNPSPPTLHGGVVAGFMESAAILHVMISSNTHVIPKVIDFSIDYLRAGHLSDSFAQCNVIRSGRRIVNVSVTAWQSRQASPIATVRAHLLLDKSQ